MHFDVLGLSMEDWVPNEVNIAHVVAVEENRILDGNTQIAKYPFRPNSFTGGDCRGPVFSFCARLCDCQLLFAAPDIVPLLREKRNLMLIF